MCMQIYVYIHQADEDGDCGIDIFEFEDMIIHLLEVKCAVKIRETQ